MQLHPVRSQPANILSTIITKEIIQSIQCLRNNIIAIVEQKECNIHNSFTNALIKALPYDTDIIHTAVDPQKKLLAICSKKNNTSKIELYDILSHQIIWQQTANNCHNQPFFSVINNDAIFLLDQQSYALHSFNYKNGSRIQYPLPNHTPLTKRLIANPIKAEFTLLAHNSDDINIFHYDKNKKSIVNKSICTAMDWKSEEIIDEHYNFDGSILACYHKILGLILIDPNTCLYEDLDSYTKRKTKFYAMTFHPTSFILAVFSIPRLLPSNPLQAFLSYWNIKTKTVIAITDLPVCSKDVRDHTYEVQTGQNIDFSPNGTELFVALYKKCLAIRVPFDVFFNTIYLPDTKNKCISLLFCLNHHPIIKNQLPKELKYFLIYHLFDMCKYSSITY